MVVPGAPGINPARCLHFARARRKDRVLDHDIIGVIPVIAPAIITHPFACQLKQDYIPDRGRHCRVACLFTIHLLLLFWTASEAACFNRAAQPSAT